MEGAGPKRVNNIMRAGQQLRELREVLSFGPFRLFPRERRLERDDETVRIGDRALDILITLAKGAGETLSNRQIVEKVWPNAYVGEASLRVHMVALRKALRDGEPETRYISNIPGRGYRFLTPVLRKESANGLGRSPRARLIEPPESTPIFGREEAVRDVTDRLLEKRFVTIVGPGGIGKTTVALAVTDAFSRSYDHTVYFFDLSMINDPALVVKALAFALGIVSRSDNPISAVKYALNDQNAIICFDCCEHLVGGVAQLAEELFLDVPSVKILATSRESLRAAGEHVRWLSALEVPPEGTTLTADEVIRFPAVQLFVKRASTSSFEFRLSDGDAMAVASICRQLDGIALAIELAAGRVPSFGISGILSRLEDRFQFLSTGERTAEPRHHTLQATIDWSYNLLSECEKVMLRRLSIFTGPFTFEAAQAVTQDSELVTTANVFSLFANLVAKSLIASDDLGKTRLYRLLDTTRHYMREKLVESGEKLIADRHAKYYQRCLPDFEQLANEPRGLPHALKCAADVANVGAALQWCFSQPEAYRTGIDLVAASAPLFLEVSLFNDCLAWVERAIASLEPADRGSRLELRLQAVLGLFLMFARGNTEEARVAILRGLELAERVGDIRYRARLMDGLYIFYLRTGNLPDGLRIAYGASSQLGSEDGSVGGYDWMRGVSAGLAGNHNEALACCEKLLKSLPASRKVYAHHFSIDHRVHVFASYARSLWVHGFPEKALLAIKQTISEAEMLDHPVSLCIALVWAIPPLIWMGDLEFAGEVAKRVASVAKKNLLSQFEASAGGWQGALFIRRGEAARGLALLQKSLDAQDEARHALSRTSFLVEMAIGQSDIERPEDALGTIDEALSRVDQTGEGILLPEVLRIKAEIVFRLHDNAFRQAEGLLQLSLDHARSQSALSWELRSAMSLTRMRLYSGGCADRRKLLPAVLSRFTEGFETADLRLARTLLEH
jgi:predicted ATPase/DNA-binding winged helix-turn-helix (wHTH) protein